MTELKELLDTKEAPHPAPKASALGTPVPPAKVK